MSSISSTVTNMQNATNQLQFQNGQKNLGNSKLTREGFMQLMLAQLQYQDPTAPQDNTQMLTQQLALQQQDDMTSMVNSTKFGQAANMVGKQVTLTDARWNFNENTSDPPEWDVTTNGPKQISGVVESVKFDTKNNKALLLIDGNYYDADNIQTLTNPSAANTTTNGVPTATGG